MKKRELEKLLQEQSASLLPSEETKKKIKRDLGIADLPAAAPSPCEDFAFAPAAADGRPVRPARGSRRLPLPALWAAAAVAVLLVVAIILSLLPKTNILPEPGKVNDKFAAIRTTEDFYAYGAASVGTLLRSSGLSAAGTRAYTAPTATPFASRTKANAPRRSGSLDETDIELLNRYMPLAEELLSDGTIVHAETAVPDGFGQYAYGMSVSCPDMTGQTATYYMYYNKEMLSFESEEGESEEEYSIEGVLVIGDAAYAVRGEQEIEIEEDESENELSFTADVGSDASLRVEREYESEEGETEQKFVYTLTEQGETIESAELEYEREGEETELQMTVRRGGQELSLRFANRAENGVFRLAARGSINGKQVAFTVEIAAGENGNSHYIYTVDEKIFDFDRPDNEDD